MISDLGYSSLNYYSAYDIIREWNTITLSAGIK